MSDTPIRTRVVTKEYEDGWSKAFGDRQRTPGSARGRWIWDPGLMKLVRAEDYTGPTRAASAPIVTDRWYEGTKTLDGVDIGSRRKRTEYMKARGLADGNDFTPSYYDGVQRDKAREEKRERHDSIVEAYKEYRR